MLRDQDEYIKRLQAQDERQARQEESQGAYVDLHLLINAIVHDQTVCQAYAMRLHRMASDVGVISDI